MAVMKNMREYTKTILIILVLTFIGTIIFDWGMNITGLRTGQGVIGKVNGEEITTVEFDRAFANQIEAYRKQTGSDDVSESQMDYLRNQVWESLVRDKLIKQTLQEKGIQASDAEILYRIYNDPPEFLKNEKTFQNEQQQFDMALYRAALNNKSLAPQWRPVEEYIRYTLPYEKFQDLLQANVRVTEDEIKKEYLKQNQTVEVKYIFFDPNNFSNTPIEISDAMINQYYNQHKEEFKEDEKRQIQYVIFSTTATPADSAEQRELAQDLIARLSDGEDFAELAETYSEDPGSKDKGGDLGYFSKGSMVKPFEDAAFSATVGDIVGPVQSRFGLHIIKVEDKRTQNDKEEVKARHILLKFEASEKTRNKARDEALYLAEEAQVRPFAEVAKEMHVKIDSTDFFAKGGGFIPGLGLNKSASQFIFANEIDKTSNIEESPQGYFVLNVIAIQKGRIKKAADVKDDIKNKLLIEKRKELAGQAAQKTYEKIQSGVSFEDAALQDSLAVKNSGAFNRGGFVPGVGRDPQFIGAAFALKNLNDVSNPVAGTRGYYLLQLIQKTEFDSADFESKKEGIRQQVIQRKQGQVFASWYANVKAQADIKDYRDKYF
jgi:parvulin-like peptidyl-prolyl isomerase